MIVLRKINATLVEKTIPPGETEEFFALDLATYEAFDWNIKTIRLNDSARRIIKISSLYTGNDIESTKYALLGAILDTQVDISVSTDDHCVLTVTNNESSSIRCSIKLKIF